MNQLPQHRRALYGRTFSQSWSAADFDPIQRHKAPVPFTDRVLGTLLAVAIGVTLALIAAHELAR